MNATENPRAVIGGNNPPPLSAILEEKSTGIRDEVAKLAIMANRWPKTDAGGLAKIATEEELEKASDLVKSARTIAKRANEMRVAEKEPFLTAGREVDAFFNAITARLERIGARKRRSGCGRKRTAPALPPKLPSARARPRSTRPRPMPPPSGPPTPRPSPQRRSPTSSPRPSAPPV